MASLIKSCVKDSSDLLAKINPQIAASLLEKMKHIDFFEKVLEKIWQQQQFLNDRFSELGSKTITILEAAKSYHKFTESYSPIKLTDLNHFVMHLIATFRDVYRCDLSCEREIESEIQEASSQYLQDLESRIQTLKESIRKASESRDQPLSELSYFETLFTQSTDKNSVEILFFNHSYIAIFNEYSPAENVDNLLNS